MTAAVALGCGGRRGGHAMWNRGRSRAAEVITIPDGVALPAGVLPASCARTLTELTARLLVLAAPR